MPRADMLRDALDHIMRVAREGITPTRRLDWIEIRARYALDGKPWSGDIRETPRDSVREMAAKNAKLREANRELIGLLEEARGSLELHNKSNACGGCEELLERIDAHLKGGKA